MLLAAGLPAGCSRHSQAPDPKGEQGGGRGGGRKTPSGFPVPRYVSAKFAKINARAGPGDDYAVKWVYRVKGLPLQVVAETDEWRRVCDPYGALSWVRARTTDAKRTVIRNAAEPLALRAQPDQAAPETATLVGHAMADLKDCQGEWCRISVGRTKGWVRAADIWGAAPAPQCR